ncbi:MULTISPECIES: DUF7541 family protein [Haloprofundus]|uniref:DUF7541 family protein n=1 Tax=Haloprofundus TaxID=1911573 RepID=UPI000E435CF2|nr:MULTISPECIES: cox cluster protein [Haloprofundus]QCJ47717.1 cox cluster protein [Haloprofundus sp. MHR1]
MDENPGLSEQYRTASPWPFFIALSIPLAEAGILFNLFAVAVGGLLLFFGCCAGMMQEAGYVDRPWRALVASAVLVFGLGALLLYADTQVAAEAVQLAERGYAVLVAGVILLLVGVLGEVFVDDEEFAV